jgi:hypothetical protein
MLGSGAKRRIRMPAPDYGMVYDITRYLKDRQMRKKTLSLEDFYSITKNGEIFLLEFTAATKAQEHVIVWARRPVVSRFDPSSPTITVFDARLYDEMEDKSIREREMALRSATYHVKLDQIVAMRINQERYNWDLVSRSFVQE